MMRKILPLIFLAACTSATPLAQKDWPIANNSGEKIDVRMRDGTRLDLESFSFTSSGLVAVRGTSHPPRRSSLGITTGSVFRYDSIDVVKVRRMDKGRTLAALAGIATATYVVIAMASDNTRPAAVERPVSTSCPFIYSYDGHSWRIDSETYAGAVARGLERSDVDNLENIAPVDGTYRLALANEADETEYTDELSLLVAEHPVGTSVYPDADGALHLVSEGAPVTMRHHDLASLPAKTRWEATFRNPHTKHAALVLRVRNTAAVPFVHLHLLNLMGDDVYSWYREINSNPDAAARTAAWYTSMAGLHVSSMTANGWQDQKVVPVVGPVIAKTIVVPIDVGANGELASVRLESSPMLWNIESASIVTDMGAPVIHEVKVSRAIDGDGVDMTAKLRDRDGDYHIAMNGSRVVAEFKATEPRLGMKNTVVARTTGHYYTKSTDERRGNRALVSRLMTPSVLSQAYFMTQYRLSLR
jgi:hypothetical protein